jgi:DNA-binding NarL/FixJ family response regulator
MSAIWARGTGVACAGWDNRRIAEKLNISEGTVKNHVMSIYTKLGVRSRAEAVAWAWK